MADKLRTSIPRSTRDAVLKEFRHRCAVCGTHEPQCHHIDEDPSNHDPTNLIPLCPNCHLTDQHNPTQPVAPGKLRLFRSYKDPTILKPQFDALFTRLAFLNALNDVTEIAAIEEAAEELYDFVSALQMGDFYGKQIAILTRRRKVLRFNDRVIGDQFQYDLQYMEQMRNARGTIERLCVELLRFQNW